MDFLAIGDVVTEPFIRLKDAKVTCEVNEEDCTISMRWGDKIPYESVEIARAVGNASNAAVAAARLGLAAALVSDIGDDLVGVGDLEQLADEQVSTEFITKHAGMKSNYHYVLSYESERTILVKHEAYPYKLPSTLPAAKWIYLSSLSEHSAPYHAEITAYFTAHPEVKLAFQPGTFQMKLGLEVLKDLYARTDIFFANKEEAERILSKPAGTDMKELLDGIRALGPKDVVLTNNREGAYALHDGKYLFVPLYPDVRAPKERTGAGDAFASSVTAALALGKSFEEALLWGPVNAMSVVQEIGAQKGLLSREKLEAYIKDAPAEYKVASF